MSHSSIIKKEIKDVSIHLSSNYSDKELLLAKKMHDDSSSSPLDDSSSSSMEEVSPQQNPNRRVVKSCFWSAAIFSINFISSILVINLSKW